MLLELFGILISSILGLFSFLKD